MAFIKEAIITIFAEYAFFILFLHILGAFVWVGGMIVIISAVYPSLKHIEDKKTQIARTLEVMQRFFMIILPFVVILIITGSTMTIGMGFKKTPLYMMIHLKEAIWIVMAFSYLLMFIRRNKAERLFVSGDLVGARELLSPISNLILPLNIILGVVALAVGITLRGF